MLKLYRFGQDEAAYWETWEAGQAKHIIHWGELGTRGETAVVTALTNARAQAKVQKEVHKAIAQGFAPLQDDTQRTLLIEYRVDGMGTSSDLDKRHRLESRMNETLGWTGLGICDGGSIGSGSMEVCCLVADFECARRVIEEDLAGTEFADFVRIYDEMAELDR